MIDTKLMNVLMELQTNEITEKHIYVNISKYIKDDKNRNTLLKIANEEQKHYDIWKNHTGRDVRPSKIKVFYYTLIARLFGYTFTIKQMENKANKYQLDSKTQELLMQEVPESLEIFNDEVIHEQELISLLDEELLQYVGSIVLGLNDALVEFTGSLAGYTFAMQSNKLISLAGLITGISATLSMASSEFLSARSEGDENAFRSALYTGIAYFFTVVALILPYLLLPEKMYGISLAIMLVLVVAIIGAFNYYISVAKDLSFKKRFGEMAGISLTVAALSFGIGLLVKKFLGVDL